MQRAILTLFTGSLRILAAHRGTTRLLLLPASLWWAGATATVSVATKWGRSSPLRCITRVQTARRAMCNLYAPNNFASPLGDVDGDGDGYVCLSRTRHLSAREKDFESH